MMKNSGASIPPISRFVRSICSVKNGWFRESPIFPFQLARSFGSPPGSGYSMYPSVSSTRKSISES